MKNPVMEGVSAAPQNKKINEGFLLFILALIQFTHIIDLVIMMPMNPILQESLKINNQEFGWLVASYAGSAGLFGIIGSFFVDKFDRRNVMILLYAGFTISTLGCALSSTYGMLMLSRSMAGVFGGMLGALVLAVVGDVIPPERRGRAMGIVMSAFSFASVIGIPTGLYFANEIGWNMPFLILSILSALVWVLIIFVFPSLKGHLVKSEKKKSIFQHFASMFESANARWAMLFIVLLMLSSMSVIPYIADYMVANVGFTKKELMYIYITGGAVTVITGPIIGKMCDRFGKQKMFVIIALISIIPLVLVTNLPAIEMWIVLMISATFFIFFGGRFIPATAITTGSVPIYLRGSFMSFTSSIQQIATAIAAAASGVMIEKTSTGAITNFWMIGIFSIVMIILCILSSYKVKQIA